MKNKIIFGILVVIICVGMFSGCIGGHASELEKKLDIIQGYKIVSIVLDTYVVDSNWENYQVSTVNLSNGDTNITRCRYNWETQEIYWPQGKPYYILEI